MANSVIQKLFRNQSQSSIRILTLRTKPSPLLLTQIPKLSEPIAFNDFKPDNYPKPIPSDFTFAYPTFSFLNPNLSPSLIRLKTEEEEEAVATEEDSKTIRADSVKKKRKKKMNKHKLRKLKKRLRRKTKT